MKFKIALVQMQLLNSSYLGSFKKIENFVNVASKKNVELIVFPEDCLGFSYGNSEFQEGSYKVYLNFFKGIAKKYGLDIVAGSFPEKFKDKYYNTSHYINFKGKLLGKYRKINAWIPERFKIFEGHKASVFKTRFGKIGLSICYDLSFPEVYREIMKKEADMIISPSFWNVNKKSEIDFDLNYVNHLCSARAFENGVTFVFCNVVGEYKFKDRKIIATGNSQVVNPEKGKITNASSSEEELIISTINTDWFEEGKNSHQCRKDFLSKYRKIKYLP